MEGGPKKKRQTPASSFVPASPQCSLPSGGLEDTAPHPQTPLFFVTDLTTPFCYRSHTCQPRSASQSPAHGHGPYDPQRGVGIIMNRITSGY